MKLPFELPVRTEKRLIIAKNERRLGNYGTQDEANYIVQAINSHKKLEIENKYLLKRSMKAGSCSFCSKGRDTGISSNSIVAIAFGLMNLNEQEMPSDKSDLAACVKAFDGLPNHRRTKDVLTALKRAQQALKEVEKK